MSIFWFHQQIANLLKCRYLLSRFFNRSNLINSIYPILLTYEPLSIRRPFQWWIVKHDDDIVQCNVNILKSRSRYMREDREKSESQVMRSRRRFMVAEEMSSTQARHIHRSIKCHSYACPCRQQYHTSSPRSKRNGGSDNGTLLTTFKTLRSIAYSSFERGYRVLRECCRCLIDKGDMVSASPQWCSEETWLTPRWPQHSGIEGLTPASLIDFVHGIFGDEWREWREGNLIEVMRGRETEDMVRECVSVPILYEAWDCTIIRHKWAANRSLRHAPILRPFSLSFCDEIKRDKVDLLPPLYLVT